VPKICVKILIIMQQSFDNDREDPNDSMIGQGIREDKDKMMNILTWGNSALKHQ